MGIYLQFLLVEQDDLGTLQKTLDEIKDVNEAKKVFTILNVPGIGKTELIKHFGKAFWFLVCFSFEHIQGKGFQGSRLIFRIRNNFLP